LPNHRSLKEQFSTAQHSTAKYNSTAQQTVPAHDCVMSWLPLSQHSTTTAKFSTEQHSTSTRSRHVMAATVTAQHHNSHVLNKTAQYQHTIASCLHVRPLQRHNMD
jgi:hypothetical protein